MKDELWRRKRLNGYAIATGFEYTWQDVDALVDIAELAVDQHIRRTFDTDVCLELDPNWVGKDRSWVEYEAECQVWTAVGKMNKIELAELTLTIVCSTQQPQLPQEGAKATILVAISPGRSEGRVADRHEPHW